MKKLITLIFYSSITACTNTNQNTLSFHAVDLEQDKNKLSSTLPLVHQFANLCLNNTNDAKKLIEKAHSTQWEPTSEKTLNKENLAKLRKITLKIPGGGAPIEENQTILAKSFEGKVFVLEISERFNRKRLTTTGCALYGVQDAFLENCADLGKLINRAPNQNTKYDKTKAHFIGWNASLASKRATIKCQHTPQSPTLPYDGTQLSVSIDHLTPVKITKKSNPQRLDVSER